ncbi:tetratricopeptide repeat protein [Sphingomicrobium clamense]|uniref:Tetratricopeptide repeat protein n=1 Tax=Sphingomicrobium clamense TaxID=2851013 RepID=A0ABS6V4N5_9SPHN|nr:hypothetical protein [Sphingomicrobium sp. B8]MBW0144507.1 hypothetical protein [Sphingomicrobium sp. B8]
MIQSSSVASAIAAFRARDRDGAVGQLWKALDSVSGSGDHYLSIVDLARELGEVEIALRAADRARDTNPSDLQLRLKYWHVLSRYNREDEVQRDLQTSSAAQRNNPAVAEVRATLAMERGDFDEAMKLARWLTANGPFPERGWFWLSTMKRFERDDPDIALMEHFISGARRDDPHARSMKD